MDSRKLSSGGTLPPITLPLVGGGTVTLGKDNTGGRWLIVLVYRGLHCPICNKYLARLESLKEGFRAANADLLAMSADPEEKATEMVRRHGLSFPVAFGLAVDDMRRLGLYISHPRSPEETDRPFAEPATFALNSEGALQLIELSNTPFNRADLAELLDTVEWIQANNYPIRGTFE